MHNKIPGLVAWGKKNLKSSINNINIIEMTIIIYFNVYVVGVNQTTIIKEQEPEVTPFSSPLSRIIEREKELEKEQQPIEFVFDQNNTTSTTHPSEEWNMVPTCNPIT